MSGFGSSHVAFNLVTCTPRWKAHKADNVEGEKTLGFDSSGRATIFGFRVLCYSCQHWLATTDMHFGECTRKVPICAYFGL
mmetsp:Transcript_40854/g.73169  ORF Transcript_40854/g.73169 Transcript_40854/m.73169 type:complete len:81 (-) Transcript_40854:325-567(-)